MRGRGTWWVWALPLLSGCSMNRGQDPEMAKLREENRMLAGKAQKLDHENQILNSLLQTSKIDQRKAEELLAANEKYVKSLQDLFGSIADQDGVTQTNEGVRIDDAVLFDSGSASLKEKGKAILSVVAAKVKEQGLRIRVDGHTDGQPIQRVKDKYETNWDLSAARALTVLKFLVSQGVPPERMHASAFGEHRPVEGQEGFGTKPNQKNRRVEIAVLRP